MGEAGRDLQPMQENEGPPSSQPGPQGRMAPSWLSRGKTERKVMGASSQHQVLPVVLEVQAGECWGSHPAAVAQKLYHV